MAYEQKPGFGSFFRNKKEKDTQPDYRGDICTPSGEQLKIAGWLKKDKNGNTFMSLKVEPPREQSEQRKSPLNTPAPSRAMPLDDDIPFAPEFR